MQKRARKDIRNLLAVLGLAMGVAVCGAAWMISVYGPLGTYVAGNVLLAPETLQIVSKQELKKKSKSRIVFERLDYAYFDSASKTIKHVDVAPEIYARFYALVAGETSLSDVPAKATAAFSHAPSTLTVHMRTEGGAKIDQEIDFVAGGDYYRVQLHEQEATDLWATFYHLHIFEEVQRLFTSSGS